MRTFATKQPSNQDSAHQKPVRKAPKPMVRERRATASSSLFPGFTGSTMLQRKLGCACGGGCPRCQEEALLQTKLKISEPGDKYEQEADHIADEVMRMPESKVQRKVEPEEKEEIVRTKDSLGSNPTTSLGIEAKIQSIKSNGQSIPKSLRTFFEPRFDRDFSQVRLHTDNHAAEVAQTINARAFTFGRDIVFGKRQYVPETPIGQYLIAHELTHVLQQKEGLQPSIQRKGNDEVGCDEKASDIFYLRMTGGSKSDPIAIIGLRRD